MNIIFWDFDGTLVHSDHLWSGSMYKALLSVDPNTAMTFEQVRVCNREGFPWQTPERDQRHLIGDEWWAHMHEHFIKSYTRFGVSPEHARQAAALVHGIIKEYDNYRLYPDTVSTLQLCKERGYRNVLLSNNYPDLEDVLSALGLLSLLDGVILSALEGYDKPRAELYNLAKARFPASSYIMVGDNEQADIVGGRNAAMTTVLVHGDISPLADYRFKTLTEIQKIL